jgi:hypothetical protein
MPDSQQQAPVKLTRRTGVVNASLPVGDSHVAVVPTPTRVLATLPEPTSEAQVLAFV